MDSRRAPEIQIRLATHFVLRFCKEYFIKSWNNVPCNKRIFDQVPFDISCIKYRFLVNFIENSRDRQFTYRTCLSKIPVFVINIKLIDYTNARCFIKYKIVNAMPISCMKNTALLRFKNLTIIDTDPKIILFGLSKLCRTIKRWWQC